MDIMHILPACICTQTPMNFEEEYQMRAKAGGYATINHGIGLYDVIWVLAEALDNTATMIHRGNITICQNVPGRVVPLEQFTYDNKKIGCLIQWNLQKTDFSGLTVSLLYDYID